MGAKIVVNIDKSGQILISVDGAKGSSCMDLTAGMEKALGVVTDRKKTKSFHEGLDLQQQQEAHE